MQVTSELIRQHLIKVEDLAWFPKRVRDASTDLLQLKWQMGSLYKPIVPKLRDALNKAESY